MNKQKREKLKVGWTRDYQLLKKGYKKTFNGCSAILAMCGYNRYQIICDFDAFLQPLFCSVVKKLFRVKYTYHVIFKPIVFFKLVYPISIKKIHRLISLFDIAIKKLKPLKSPTVIYSTL